MRAMNPGLGGESTYLYVWRRVETMCQPREAADMGAGQAGCLARITERCPMVHSSVVHDA